ncbi:MAG: cyclic nucleotide-binding domain-containing protein [Rhodothermales bacterium]
MIKPLTMLVQASLYRLGLECELPDDLRELALFSELNDREEQALRRAVVGRRFHAGERVFQEGEPGLGMYVVASGEVEILRCESGRSVAQLGVGTFFGEIALLNEVTRMATARAKTESELIILFQPAFDALIDRHPRLGVKLLIALARIMGVRQIHTGNALDALVQSNGRDPSERPDPPPSRS